MRRKKLSGFTLVEVLVGLTLLGFILVMLYSGLYITSRFWEAGDKQAQTNDDYRLILSFIRTEINQIVPLFYQDDENSHVIFQGEEESVYFISTLPTHRGGAGLYMLSLNIEEDDNGKSSLMFHYQPLTPGFVPYEGNAEAESQILIDNVSEISIAYFGREKPEDEPDWHSEWKLMMQLPELIRIRIDSTEPGVLWPELYVRVPAQVERGQPQMVFTKANNT